jgi:ElaB/YqjD/DUF883 family membrane-anchored ribosome-binding protein
MELYYKDLISEDTSLEKLVDDLMLAVQGTDKLIATAGNSLDPERKQEILSHLRRLQDYGMEIKRRAVATARQTDQILRRHPYPSIGVALVAGVFTGLLIQRALGKPTRED